MRRLVSHLFLVGFVVAGADGWRFLGLEAYLREEPSGIARSFNRDASTDEYIRALLLAEGVPREALPRPADSIRAALASLGVEGGIIFVVPRDVPKYNVMFLTFKHVSLPRPAYYLPCDNPAVASIGANEKIAAVVAYLVEPPSKADDNQSSWQLMPRLVLTRASETDAWKPFCSR